MSLLNIMAGGVRLRPASLFGVLSVATTVVVITTSCTSSSPKQHAQISLPEKNISQWVMPLDQYIPMEAETANYAEQLLVEPCMERAGFEWTVPWQDVQIKSVPTTNGAGRGLFNVAIAKQYGYHGAPNLPTSTDVAWSQFSAAHANIPDGEEQALASCIDSARKVLPILPSSAQIASGLGQQAYDAAAKDPKVMAAAAKWKSCMAPVGISDLPDSPRQMPTQSLASEFGGGTNASPQEIQIAVQDANCRDSSGWTNASYNAEWSKNVTLLKQNADTLEAVKNEIANNKTAVMKVISEHAPKEPAGE